MAAKQKDCESIDQKCSKLNELNTQRYIFQYHCLINSWGNATIEVCALNRSIFGKIYHIHVPIRNRWNKYRQKAHTDNPYKTNSYFYKLIELLLRYLWFIIYIIYIHVIIDYTSYFNLGYCAEYLEDGALVQDKYDADCKHHHPPCPQLYNSAEAYLCTSLFLIDRIIIWVVFSSNVKIKIIVMVLSKRFKAIFSS